jgi:hypothetical protein
LGPYTICPNTDREPVGWINRRGLPYIRSSTSVCFASTMLALYLHHLHESGWLMKRSRIQLR